MVSHSGLITVMERAHNRRPIEVPANCPSCGTPLVREEEQVALYCPNTFGCPVQKARSIEFFSHRDAMNIEHLGPSLVAQLVERGLIEDVADLYDLTAEQLVELERVGPKSAENVIQAIAHSKKPPRSRASSSGSACPASVRCGRARSPSTTRACRS